MQFKTSGQEIEWTLFLQHPVTAVMYTRKRLNFSLRTIYAKRALENTYQAHWMAQSSKRWWLSPDVNSRRSIRRYVVNISTPLLPNKS